MTNASVKSKLIETLTEKVIEQIALNTPIYDCGKVQDKGILENIYDQNLFNIREHIYECFNYFEYPLSVLGINSKNKDCNHSVFGIMALDIAAFQNNKKHTWEEVKNDPILSKEFIETYGALSENEDDLYFDCFKKLDSIEDKIAFIKEHFVLHSIGIGETKEINENDSFVLHGAISKKTTARDYRENPDKVSEILELDI